MLKDNYLRFILEWPERYMRGGKTFKELFKLNGDISLWWLSEMQKKDTEASAVLLKLLRSAENPGLPQKIEQKAKPLLRYVAARAIYLLSVLGKMLIFKYLIERRPAAADEEVLFVSMFGLTLKKNGDKLQDRYYLDLPDLLEKKAGKKVKYLSFYYGSLWGLFRERNSLRQNIVFYEEYLKIRDILKALDPKNLLQYALMEFSDSYRKSYDYNGKNLFRLFLPEMRTSFAGPGIPEMILLSAAAERIAKKRPVKSVVSFLETYPYSRALYYGFKKGNPKIKTVAYQHATITPNKMWYVFNPEEMSRMPVPDYFIFQGTMGRDILTKGGYPGERCCLTGSPRFDALYQLEKKPIQTEIPAGRRIVLVPTSYAEADSKKVVDMIVEVAKIRKDLFFIFKSHPNFPIDALLADRGINNYALSYDNIHQLIVRADVLVTTYSMTADEAIALNCPVISIDNDQVVDMSTFYEIEAAIRVKTAPELGAALDLVFNEPAKLAPYKAKWPELVRASFYRIDGLAKQRVLESLERITGQEPLN